MRRSRWNCPPSEVGRTRFADKRQFLQWDRVVEDDDVDDDSLTFPWDPGWVLSTESGAGALGIFGGIWQDSSVDAEQFLA